MNISLLAISCSSYGSSLSRYKLFVLNYLRRFGILSIPKDRIHQESIQAKQARKKSLKYTTSQNYFKDNKDLNIVQNDMGSDYFNN